MDKSSAFIRDIDMEIFGLLAGGAASLRGPPGGGRRPPKGLAGAFSLLGGPASTDLVGPARGVTAGFSSDFLIRIVAHFFLRFSLRIPSGHL